ncbi:hypothetical protein C8J56DRAFT_1160070 [Mycena floridula]|nr:hypothetical protein C8J56DRAFT_1160070 [Mycena floridula]
MFEFNLLYGQWATSLIFERKQLNNHGDDNPRLYTRTGSRTMMMQTVGDRSAALLDYMLIDDGSVQRRADLQRLSEDQTVSVANAASLNVIRAAGVKVLMDTKPPGKLFVAFHDQMNLISISPAIFGGRFHTTNPRQILDKEVFERELAALDEQISGYLRAAEALRRRREKRVEDFSSARRILSPIRRVPPEIVGEIVLAALADSDGISLDVRKGPWVYSRVCSLWRRQVLSSTVRSDIKVHYRPLPARRTHSHSPAATILREIFLRSSKQPCRLKLCIRSESPEAKDLLAAAVENSPLWFDVELDLASPLLPGLKPVQDCIPLLQQLRIHPTSTTRIHSSDMNYFRQAPELRSLNLRGIRKVHLLKWAQLTEFHHFAGSSPTNHLRGMSNLVSLICYGRDRLSSNDGEIVLQSLLTLNARQSDSTLLAVFRLPVLEDLRVNGSHLLAIPGLVQRSSCSLKHLSFEDSPAFWDRQFATTFAPVLQQILTRDPFIGPQPYDFSPRSPNYPSHHRNSISTSLAEVALARHDAHQRPFEAACRGGRIPNLKLFTTRRDSAHLLARSPIQLQSIKTNTGILQHLSTLFHDSSNLINHLSLTDCTTRCTIEAVGSFLPAVPRISILDLSGIRVRPGSEDQILEILHLLNNTKLVPLLRRLVLPGSILLTNQALEPLLTMVQSRKMAASPIKEVRFTYLAAFNAHQPSRTNLRDIDSRPD